MLTLSNALSFARVPLAFLFLQEAASLRILAVVLAMITDSIDGYFARKSQSNSKIGVILDPTTDKFFVYFALITLFSEGKLSSWQVVALLSRDVGVCLYGATIFLMGRWKSIVLSAFRWGKVATSLQFIVLIGVLAGISFPWTIYALSGALGIFAFFELYRRSAVTS